MDERVFFRFSSMDWADELEVFEVDAVERISAPFFFALTVASSVDPTPALGRPAKITIGLGERIHREVHGMIWSIDDRETLADGRRLHRVRIVPRMEALTLQVNLEVFVDAALPDLLRAALADGGLDDDRDFDLRLTEAYPARELIVQYDETDLAFVSRLCEQAGISFYFEHESGRDVVVFCDSNDMFAESDPIPLQRRGEQTDVYELEVSRRIVAQNYVVRDYDYKNPNLDLTASAQIPVGIGGTIVEHGAHHDTPEEGARIARIRAEEQLAQRIRHRAKTGDARICAGHVFTLVDPGGGDLELLPIEVTHHARQKDREQGDNRLTYSGSFEAITRNVQFRPRRVTPKPKVAGIVTGHIDASIKSDYAQLDEQGRYRVRLDFDSARHDAGKGSRPIRMAQPHVGPGGYGMHFPLRRGVEVVLACIGGDPDRPVIVGTVPNALTPSVVDSSDSTKNMIRTGAGNEIALDDTMGSERIKISTPSGGTVFQLGSPNAPEFGAILATNGAATTTAVAGITTIGAFKTAISAVTDYRTSGSITTVAKPTDKSNPMILLAVLDTLSAAVVSSCDLVEKGYEFDKVSLQSASEDATSDSKKKHDKVVRQSTAFDDALAELGEDGSIDLTELKAAWARLKLARAAKAITRTRVRHAKAKITKEMVDGEPEVVALAAAVTDDKAATTELAAAEAAFAESAARAKARSGSKLDGIVAAADALKESAKDDDTADEAAYVAKLKFDNWKFKETEVGAVVVEVKKWASLAKANTGAVGEVVKFGRSVIHFLSGLLGLSKTAEEKLTNEKRWANIGTSTMFAYSSTISSAAFDPSWMVGGWSLPTGTVHVIGSKTATAVYGEKNLLLWAESVGIDATDLLGTVEERLYLKVGRDGEIRANEKLNLVGEKRAYLGSNEHVLIESMKTLTTRSWGGATSVESKELSLAGSDGVKIESTKADVKITARTNVELSGNRLKLDSPTQIDARVGPSKIGMTATPARIKLEVAGTVLEITAAGVTITAGQSVLVVDASGIRVEGATRSPATST